MLGFFAHIFHRDPLEKDEVYQYTLKKQQEVRTRLKILKAEDRVLAGNIYTKKDRKANV